MTHPIKRKAQVLALLMTGHSVKETAEACGVPKQTISRWKKICPSFCAPWWLPRLSCKRWRTGAAGCARPASIKMGLKKEALL
jgi:hypothetical protein